MACLGAEKLKFDDLYVKALKLESDAKLVSTFFDMIGILQRANQSYVAPVPPMHMGIHPKNRSGKKMVADSMHKEGNKIHSVGFSLKLCGPDRALAFENNPHTNNCGSWTQIVTSTSKKFAKVAAGTIRGGAVGCTHLNQWLAAVIDQAETPHSHLCEPGKNTICTTLVTSNNDDLIKATTEGLHWTMIKWQVEVEYPEFPAIVQRALNVEHHVGEGAC